MCLSLAQIQKGKLHGSIDVGLSVMSIKKRARRIDLDTEEHIYHLKVTLMARRVNTVILQLMNRRSAEDGVKSCQSFFFFRSNLKTYSTPGCPSCVITGCTDRTRLCDLPGRPPCERFLPQLPSSPPSLPLVWYVKPR